MLGDGAEELPLEDAPVEEAPRTALSIKEQADFVDDLVRLCTLRDGSLARDTLLCLTPEQAAELKALAARLHRIAPHEAEVRALVAGR